jgi:hypothetical protein
MRMQNNTKDRDDHTTLQAKQGSNPTMASHTLHPELERRIAELEQEANQGDGFTAIDWFWLLALGVFGPVLLLYWGWPS